jgi:glyoxylate reductase
MGNLRDAAALICQLTQKVDAEVLAAGPKLRVVANVAVGFDNIDVATATARGIAVTNTPGVLDDSTADFTWALLMAVARRVVEGDRFLREGKWKGWDLMLLLGADVHGKTLGIFGLGRIGRKVAERARGFGMRVLYHDAVRAPSVERELGVNGRRRQLLREADFVTLHVPLLPATRHYIGGRELAAMKPTAYLINAARGRWWTKRRWSRRWRRQIAGAALDVFENEPQVHQG